MTSHPSAKPTSVVSARRVVLTLVVLAISYVVASTVGVLFPGTVFGQSWTEPGRDILIIMKSAGDPPPHFE